MLNNFWVNICIMLFGVVIAALSQILLKKADLLPGGYGLVPLCRFFQFVLPIHRPGHVLLPTICFIEAQPELSLRFCIQMQQIGIACKTCS